MFSCNIFCHIFISNFGGLCCIEVKECRNAPSDVTAQPTLPTKTHSTLKSNTYRPGQGCVCCADNSSNKKCFACDLSLSCCQEGLIKSPITLI